MWEFKWPWVGIAIPCLLIGGLGYGSHFFILRQHMTPAAQICYQVYVSMVWVSYLLAITVGPGSPPPGYTVPEKQWKRWCAKCKNYKPQRTHHCRKCNLCVLMMDHHCPWTNNCVGHHNMPHFLRFLGWVIFTTGFTLVHHTTRALDYFHSRHLPAYLIRKSELAAVIVLGPLNLFVFLAVLLLFVKCLYHIATGKTQIEVWELERIEAQFHSERLWTKIRYNYELVHGKPMPTLTSWNLSSLHHNEVELRRLDDSVVPASFTFDDIVFPYDLGIWANLCAALGPVWSWVLPWARAPGSGCDFATNDDDDQLELPWPIDGGNIDVQYKTWTDDDLRQLANALLIKKHLDPRSNLERSQWTNDLGESLDDYGVDVAAEQDEGLA